MYYIEINYGDNSIVETRNGTYEEMKELFDMLTILNDDNVTIYLIEVNSEQNELKESK